MTLECLPKAIKDRLSEVMQENRFSFSAELSISDISTSEIGSSCTITIQQVERQLRLFVKFFTNDNDGDFTLEATDYFNNETIFYGEILKQFGEELTCVAKCYGVGRDVPFIMMEDLTGYVSCESLSVDLVRLILEQLGRFHAYSFAVKNRCPRMFREATSQLKECLFAPISPYRKIFVHAIHDAFKLLKKSLPTDSVYVRTFADFILGVFDRLSILLREDEDYKVVTHGDLWPNNILWNSSTNSVKFIDFQGCRYSSPVHDLMLILLIGLDKSSRESHREDLIKSYHNSLCGQLENFGFDPLRIFPISALESQILKHTKFAMGVALAGLPLFYNKDNVSVSSNVEGYDKISQFFKEISSKKSLKCKSKILEIIIECIDRSCL